MREGDNIWISGGKRLGAAVFESAQNAQHLAGIDLLALGGKMAENFFDGGELLAFAVDDEVAFVAEFLDVLAQNSHAEVMKCANGWLEIAFAIFAFAFGGDFANAGLHFTRGFVGEGDGENIFG